MPLSPERYEKLIGTFQERLLASHKITRLPGVAGREAVRMTQELGELAYRGGTHALSIWSVVGHGEKSQVEFLPWIRKIGNHYFDALSMYEDSHQLVAVEAMKKLGYERTHMDVENNTLASHAYVMTYDDRLPIYFVDVYHDRILSKPEQSALERAADRLPQLQLSVWDARNAEPHLLSQPSQPPESRSANKLYSTVYKPL